MIQLTFATNKSSFSLFPLDTLAFQRFAEQPKYTEVNPGQDTLLTCKIIDKRGTCSWQKDNKVRQNMHREMFRRFEFLIRNRVEAAFIFIATFLPAHFHLRSRIESQLIFTLIINQCDKTAPSVTCPKLFRQPSFLLRFGVPLL